MQPLLQGKLDFLCGFYAAINAVRVSTQSEAEPDFEHVRLTAEAIDEAQGENKESLFVRSFGPRLNDGLSWSEVKIALKVYGQAAGPITFYSPRLKRPHDLDQVWSLLENHMRQDGTSAVIGFWNSEYGHWSAIESATDKVITLLDSAGRSREAHGPIRKDHACIGRRQSKWLPEPGKEYALVASEILLVTAEGGA